MERSNAKRVMLRGGALVLVGALAAVPLRGSDQPAEKSPASDMKGADSSGKIGRGRVEVVTAERLDDAVLNAPNHAVMVYIQGKDCSSCNGYLRVVKELAESGDYSNISFIAVNLSEGEARAYGVRGGFPVIAFFRPEGMVAMKRVAMLQPSEVNEKEIIRRLHELTNAGETKQEDQTPK